MSWYSDHRNALSASSSKNSTLHIREKMSERKCTVFSKIFSVVYDGMTIRTFNFPRENHRETNSFQLNITILNVNYFKSNFISQQIFSLVCRTALAQILINDHLFHYIFFYQKMNDRKILGYLIKYDHENRICNLFFFLRLVCTLSRILSQTEEIDLKWNDLKIYR